MNRCSYCGAGSDEGCRRSCDGGYIEPQPVMIPTAQEVDEAKTPAGGWTRETLAGWGVPWPPPKGWRKRLSDGEYGGKAQ